MYFDNCNTIEELNEIRENLINQIQEEYALISKRIRQSQVKEDTTNLIKIAQRYVDTNVVAMAYPISNKKGNRDEIIFNADGTVTI